MAGKRDAEADPPSSALVKKSRTDEVAIAGGKPGAPQVRRYSIQLLTRGILLVIGGWPQ